MQSVARRAATGAIVTVVSGFAIFVAAPHYGTALAVLTRVFTNAWAYACIAAAWVGVSTFRRGAWSLSHSDSYDSEWKMAARLLLGAALTGVGAYGLFLLVRA
jgi:succinate dehydrogenase hydrophobic anchor subunit